MKNKSINSICDIFLYRLYKLETKKEQPEFLVEILHNRSVFFDNEIINKVINLLKEKDFISEIEGVLTFPYGEKKYRKRFLRFFFRKEKQNGMTIEELDKFIENIEGRNKLYQLTIKGRNFVQNKQELDEERKAERKRLNEKWLDRLYGFIAGLLIAIISMLLKKLCE